MAMDTDILATDDVVDVLNDLIENSRDGEYGFRTCAEEVKSAALKQLFNDRAASCGQAASELAQLILGLGGKPAEGGTASGAVHRGWVHVKGMVGANSELSMLEECERGEDAADGALPQGPEAEPAGRRAQPWSSARPRAPSATTTRSSCCATRRARAADARDCRPGGAACSPAAGPQECRRQYRKYASAGVRQKAG